MENITCQQELQNHTNKSIEISEDFVREQNMDMPIKDYNKHFFRTCSHSPT